MSDTTTFAATLDGTKIGTLRSLHPRVAKALLFPDHVGKNLDALFDALCDLEGIGEAYTHVTLTIRGAAFFLKKEKPARREAALQVLQDACLPDNRYDTRVFRVVFEN
jgi:RNAse (barnase) inhibitor barstar